MKQFRISMLTALMLCILIGYFEPANAAKVNLSVRKISNGTNYIIMNNVEKPCPVFPNPMQSASQVTVASTEKIKSVVVTPIGTDGSVIEGYQWFEPIISAGGDIPQSVIEGYQWFEPIISNNGNGTPSVIEGYQWFEPKTASDLVVTKLTMPDMADGLYAVTIITQYGTRYTAKIYIGRN